jgi:hypothetical protein
MGLTPWWIAWGSVGGSVGVKQQKQVAEGLIG